MIKRKRAIGLLELILVLVIVAVLLVLAAKRYKVYQFQTNVYTLEKTVNTLIQKYDSYYLENCRSNWSLNKSVNFGELGLNVAQVPNPFGPSGANNYEFGTIDKVIANTKPKRYARQLYIRIPFDSKYSDNMAYFKGRLNANATYTTHSHKGLEWTFLPYQPGVHHDPTSPNWLLKLNMRKFNLNYDEDNPCWFPSS